MRTPLLLAVIVAFSAVSGTLQACPAGDLDENCTVNLRDLHIFVGQWLDDAACSEPNCADLDGDNKVDMTDLAFLAEKWRWTDAPLVISEFMASNRTTMLDGDGKASDWIEIHNANDANISLNGWYLTDDDRDLTKWRFPDGIMLASGGYLVVFASGQDDANYPYLDPNGYYHTNFKLDKGGDYLALVAGDGVTISHEYKSYEYDDGSLVFHIKGPTTLTASSVPTPIRRLILMRRRRRERSTVLLCWDLSPIRNSITTEAFTKLPFHWKLPPIPPTPIYITRPTAANRRRLPARFIPARSASVQPAACGPRDLRPAGCQRTSILKLISSPTTSACSRKWTQIS